MTTFPNSPKVLKAGLVLLERGTQVPRAIIVLQYNPDSLTRTLAPQTVGGEAADRALPLRLKAPPIETIKLDADIDAVDQLEFPDQNRRTTETGIQRELSVLETIIYPPSERLIMNNTLAQLGTLEIAPVEGPLTLFIWSKLRIVPVRITEFSVVESAFDPLLNPIRAKVTLGMRVLTVNDVGFEHRGGSVFMAYLQAKEQLAREARSGTLSELGLGRLP